MKILTGILIVAVITLVVGCATSPAPEKYGEVNGKWVEKRVTISIEELPPSPEDIGVIGVEPKVSETGLLEIDLPTFIIRWNEEIKDSLQGKLSISSIDLRYGKYELYFEKKLIAWLVLDATIDYKTGKLMYAGVRWNRVPDVDPRFIAASQVALIYAINDGFTLEDVRAVIEKGSNIKGIGSKELDISSADFTYEGLKYSFIRSPNVEGFWVEAVEQ